MPRANPNSLPRALRRVANGPVRDIRSLVLEPDAGMEAARRALCADASSFVRDYPNLFYETALLLGALRPPPARPVYRPAPGAETYVLPLYFLPRAAYPIAYSMRMYYDLSPECMVVSTCERHETELVWMLRRIPIGIADLVDLAYTSFVEARPCRRPIPRPIPRR